MSIPRLRGKLFEGPIDIVGDVHGEIDALFDLLKHLGYSPQGEHPQGRRLVFLGDLCDRGPDSPAVIRVVSDMIKRDLAQCLLGNHELNVLRGSPKSGNGWFFAHDHDRQRHRFMHSTPASEHERVEINEFFASMPLTLERDDLRLVHAAWLPEQVAAIAEHEALYDAESLHRHYETLTEAKMTAQGLKHAVEAEHIQYGHLLSDSHAHIPALPALGLYDETYQMTNPVRVLTSGVERRTEAPLFASGKWRMVRRVSWWEDYTDTVPVIVGHYWRWYDEATRMLISNGEADLFAAYASDEWLGLNNNVYCVDFSVGGRYRERELGRRDHWGTRLGAVRWPEQELIFDDGQRMQLRPYG